VRVRGTALVRVRDSVPESIHVAMALAGRRPVLVGKFASRCMQHRVGDEQLSFHPADTEKAGAIGEIAGEFGADDVEWEPDAMLICKQIRQQSRTFVHPR